MGKLHKSLRNSASWATLDSVPLPITIGCPVWFMNRTGVCVVVRAVPQSTLSTAILMIQATAGNVLYPTQLHSYTLQQETQ